MQNQTKMRRTENKFSFEESRGGRRSENLTWSECRVNKLSIEKLNWCNNGTLPTRNNYFMHALSTAEKLI